MGTHGRSPRTMTTAGDAPVATDMRPTSSSEPRLGKRTRLLSRDLAMRKETLFSPHHAEDEEVPTRQFNVKKTNVPTHHYCGKQWFSLQGHGSNGFRGNSRDGVLPSLMSCSKSLHYSCVSL